MAQAAQTVAECWVDGTYVDLDTECRRLTLRALGRSVLGLNLDEHAESHRRAAAGSAGIRRRSGVAADGSPAMDADPGPPASTRGQRHAATTRRPDPAGVPRQSDLRRTIGAGADRGQRPRTGRALSDDEIRDELVAFMLAGHDTTFHHTHLRPLALGNHPDMQDKVHPEVTETSDGALTPEDVPALKYTVQVLHEALRLCPRSRPYRGWSCGTSRSTATLSRPATFWWSASTHYIAIPRCGTTRWSSTPTDSAHKTPTAATGWQYLPFGAGPRSCIGDHFAMLEATLALATIVQRAEIRSTDADFPMIVPFTTVAAKPIRAHIKARACHERTEKGL